jgi:hypothetical protein
MLDFCEHFHSIHGAHLEVDERQVEAFPLQQFEDVLWFGTECGCESKGIDTDPHGTEDVFFVIDNQNMSLPGHDQLTLESVR